VADLLGTPKPKAKAAAKRAATTGGKAATGTRAPRAKYDDGQRITVVEAPTFREGSELAKAWARVQASKTVGAYKAAREKAKLPGALGPLFAKFVANGNIKVR